MFAVWVRVLKLRLECWRRLSIITGRVLEQTPRAGVNWANRHRHIRTRRVLFRVYCRCRRPRRWVGTRMIRAGLSYNRAAFKLEFGYDLD